MGTTWTTDSSLLGLTVGPSIDPWPAYASFRVLSYVDAATERAAESRTIRSGDEEPCSKDVRSAFAPRKRLLTSYT